jgi:hypothetical protein
VKLQYNIQNITHCHLNSYQQGNSRNVDNHSLLRFFMRLP